MSNEELCSLPDPIYFVPVPEIWYLSWLPVGFETTCVAERDKLGLSFRHVHLRILEKRGFRPIRVSP